MRRIGGPIIVGAVLAVILGACAPDSSPSPVSGSAAELAAARAVAQAIMDWPETAQFTESLRKEDGLPATQVADGTLTVFTIVHPSEASGPMAQQLCVLVASLAQTRDVGVPGGIHSIVIAAADGESLFSCASPPEATWPPSWPAPS